MRRREFLGVLGGAAAAWPVTARAQQPERMRRIGMLMGGAEGDSQGEAGLAALQPRCRSSAGRTVETSRSTFAGRRRTSTACRLSRKSWSVCSPICSSHIRLSPSPRFSARPGQYRSCFCIVSDPVGSGFVASLPRPGGNITGFVNIESSLGGKWIEVLKEIVPGVTRAALMFNPDTATYPEYYLAPFETAARISRDRAGRSSGPQRRRHRARDRKPRRTAATRHWRVDAGLACRRRTIGMLIISLAARHRVLTVYPYHFWVDAGGLVSYGIDQVDLYRRAPTYVDRILKGAKPAELPVQLPTGSNWPSISRLQRRLG